MILEDEDVGVAMQFLSSPSPPEPVIVLSNDVRIDL